MESEIFRWAIDQGPIAVVSGLIIYFLFKRVTTLEEKISQINEARFQEIKEYANQGIMLQGILKDLTEEIRRRPN